MLTQIRGRHLIKKKHNPHLNFKKMPAKELFFLEGGTGVGGDLGTFP